MGRVRRSTSGAAPVPNIAAGRKPAPGPASAAGTESVIELHGSGGTVSCLDCGAREPREDVQGRLEQEMPPRCRTCGGTHIKPAVVFFGEALPADAVEEAFKLASSCDLMLVV